MVVKQTSRGNVLLEEQELFSNLRIYIRSKVIDRNKRTGSSLYTSEEMNIFGGLNEATTNRKGD